MDLLEFFLIKKSVFCKSLINIIFPVTVKWLFFNKKAMPIIRVNLTTPISLQTLLFSVVPMEMRSEAEIPCS